MHVEVDGHYISPVIYINNILMMLLISPYRLKSDNRIMSNSLNNVASDVQSEGDKSKYPYKDEEHTEKSTSLNRVVFFVFVSLFVHISYRRLPVRIYIVQKTHLLSVNILQTL